ncbi:hypothetical protein AYI69_g5089 [Smittium culicis]|uniref:Uncharacterized protein n=1 Tax=Smittium culicis TaxID=133412 RepID=A0A1R1Y8J3_9FUNG|nr:hypothetical protein AYI69_g5089 [Smittium culicis]
MVFLHGALALLVLKILNNPQTLIHGQSYKQHIKNLYNLIKPSFNIKNIFKNISNKTYFNNLQKNRDKVNFAKYTNWKSISSQKGFEPSYIFRLKYIIYRNSLNESSYRNNKIFFSRYKTKESSNILDGNTTVFPNNSSTCKSKGNLNRISEYFSILSSGSMDFFRSSLGISDIPGEKKSDIKSDISRIWMNEISSNSTNHAVVDDFFKFINFTNSSTNTISKKFRFSILENFRNFRLQKNERYMLFARYEDLLNFTLWISEYGTISQLSVWIEKVLSSRSVVSISGIPPELSEYQVYRSQLISTVLFKLTKLISSISKQQRKDISDEQEMLAKYEEKGKLVTRVIRKKSENYLYTNQLLASVFQFSALVNDIQASRDSFWILIERKLKVVDRFSNNPSSNHNNFDIRGFEDKTFPIPPANKRNVEISEYNDMVYFTLKCKEYDSLKFKDYKSNILNVIFPLFMHMWYESRLVDIVYEKVESYSRGSIDKLYLQDEKVKTSKFEPIIYGLASALKLSRIEHLQLANLAIRLFECDISSVLENNRDSKGSVRSFDTNFYKNVSELSQDGNILMSEEKPNSRILLGYLKGKEAKDANLLSSTRCEFNIAERVELLSNLLEKEMLMISNTGNLIFSIENRKINRTGLPGDKIVTEDMRSILEKKSEETRLFNMRVIERIIDGLRFSGNNDDGRSVQKTLLPQTKVLDCATTKGRVVQKRASSNDNKNYVRNRKNGLEMEVCARMKDIGNSVRILGDTASVLISELSKLGYLSLSYRVYSLTNALLMNLNALRGVISYFDYDLGEGNRGMNSISVKDMKVYEVGANVGQVTGYTVGDLENGQILPGIIKPYAAKTVYGSRKRVPIKLKSERIKRGDFTGRDEYKENKRGMSDIPLSFMRSSLEMFAILSRQEGTFIKNNGGKRGDGKVEVCLVPVGIRAIKSGEEMVEMMRDVYREVPSKMVIEQFMVSSMAHNYDISESVVGITNQLDNMKMKRGLNNVLDSLYK